MSRFKTKKSKGVGAINTSSLPDIIFMLLFFFMVTTVMREVSLKVKLKLPQATEVQKLEKKDSNAIHALLTDAADKAYAGDIEGFLSYRTPDALSIADDLRNPVTLDEALKMYKSVNVRAISPITVDEIMVSGDLGFARVTYATEFLSKDGRPLQRLYSRHFYILRRQKSGSWKIVRDIWSNIPYDSGDN